MGCVVSVFQFWQNFRLLFYMNTFPKFVIRQQTNLCLLYEYLFAVYFCQTNSLDSGMELLSSEFVIVNLLRSPGIDSPPSESISGLLNRLKIPEPVFVNVYGAQESIPPAYVAGEPLRQIWLSYRSARLGIDSWAPQKVYKYALSYPCMFSKYHQPKSQIPDWGIKLTPAQGCRTGPCSLAGRNDDYAGVDFIPLS